MKNNSISTAFLFSAFMTLVVSNTSFGQEEQKEGGKTPPTIEELFKKMDTNKDEKLSKDEVKGPLKDDFAKIDTNKDGFLSKEELKKAPKPERRKPENQN